MKEIKLFTEHLGEGVEVNVIDEGTPNSLNLKINENGYLGRFRPLKETSSQATYPLLLQVKVPLRRDEKIYMWNIKSKSRDGMYWIEGKRDGDSIVFEKRVHLRPGTGEWKDVFTTIYPQNYMRFLRVTKSGQVISGNIGIVTQMRSTFVRVETIYDLQTYRGKGGMKLPAMRADRQNYVDFWMEKIQRYAKWSILPRIDAYRKRLRDFDVNELKMKEGFVVFYSEMEGTGMITSKNKKDPSRNLNAKVHFSEIEPGEDGFSTLKAGQKVSFRGVKPFDNPNGRLKLQMTEVSAVKKGRSVKRSVVVVSEPKKVGKTTPKTKNHSNKLRTRSTNSGRVVGQRITETKVTETQIASKLKKALGKSSNGNGVNNTGTKKA